jgi:hypothetical protein
VQRLTQKKIFDNHANAPLFCFFYLQMQFAVNLTYFFGSVLFIPASVLLYWPDDTKIPYTVIFIVASLGFLGGAIVDIYGSWDGKKNSLVVLLLYLGGGFLFSLGSFLFLSYDAMILLTGIWVFRFGSIHYITGSGLLIYFLPSPRAKCKVIATLSYMIGSTLFIAGGIVSQFGGPAVTFATIWTIGSVAFTAGASINLVALALNSMGGIWLCP